jgi:hypothetical protein
MPLFKFQVGISVAKKAKKEEENETIFFSSQNYIFVKNQQNRMKE